MAKIARDAGITEEELCRELDGGGSPKFETILKVINALGFKLKISIRQG
jgi:probable addiction module antidote protein